MAAKRTLKAKGKAGAKKGSAQPNRRPKAARPSSKQGKAKKSAPKKAATKKVKKASARKAPVKKVKASPKKAAAKKAIKKTAPQKSVKKAASKKAPTKKLKKVARPTPRPKKALKAKPAKRSAKDVVPKSSRPSGDVERKGGSKKGDKKADRVEKLERPNDKKPDKRAEAPKPSRQAPSKPSKRGNEGGGQSHASARSGPPPSARPASMALRDGARPGGRGLSAGPLIPQRGILPPPKGGKKDQLTLLPARSSQPSSAGRMGGGSARPSEAPRSHARGGSPRGVTLAKRTSDRPSGGLVSTPLPIPVRKIEAPPSLEDRFSRIEKRLEAMDEPLRREFYNMFDQAWVSHDSALEGSVYTREEIQAGFSVEPILTDSSLQPATDEIRRHREAIEFVRDVGLRKKLPVTVDVVKKIFLILHPSEGDLKTVKYRRDVPQHRLYFHEYAPPDKIAFRVRQIVDWLNLPETRKTRNALRIAARVHYDMVRVYPFQNDSGKVARLFMNLLLYRAGYPPAIIHAKERQGYYEALKGEPNRILRIVQDAVEDGLASIEKFLDEHDARKHRPY